MGKTNYSNCPNLALIANDIHGLKDRQDAFFQALAIYRDSIEYIILNGDICGGPIVGELQNLFYELKNRSKEPTSPDNYLAITKAFETLESFLLNLTPDNQLNLGTFNNDSNRETICRCYHFGVFLSWICKQNPTLRPVFEEDIISSISAFIAELKQIVHPRVPKIILNTGNWEEATPLDLDPTDLTVETKIPYEQRLSRKIWGICVNSDIVFNEGIIIIDDTAIIGARAIIDAGKDRVSLGDLPQVSQVVAHFPCDYSPFPGYEDSLTAAGTCQWLEALGATTLLHGHIHLDECKCKTYTLPSLTSGDIITHMVGLKGYAFVRL